jgi:ketosteroid isomerase-like protein
MSRENVELVAAAFEASDRRDKDRLFALLDPSVELELVGFFPDQEHIRKGPEQIWEYLTFLDEEFEDIRVERGEYVEVGERVLVPVRVRGKGRSSGAQGDFSFTSVFTVANGKLLSGRNYATRAEALEAVGLRE